MYFVSWNFKLTGQRCSPRQLVASYILLVAFSTSLATDGIASESINSSSHAIVEISFFDHRSHSSRTMRLKGLFGLNSRMSSVHAEMIHVRDNFGDHNGCNQIQEWNIPIGKPWIALVARGECNFEQKINNLHKRYNASAVVIYNNADEELFIINHSPLPIVTVLISQQDGDIIADLFDNGVVISMMITSDGIMLAEKADENARAQYLASSLERRSRTVLTLSVLIIVSVTIGLLVLLIQAARAIADGKSCKDTRRDINKMQWPVMSAA